VSDNVTAEIVAASEALVDEVKAGNLGEQAIDNRLVRAKSLHARVREYESILGKTLEKVHNVIAVSEIALHSATVIQEDSTVFDDIFSDALALV
jgi:hypothetical protein